MRHSLKILDFVESKGRVRSKNGEDLGRSSSDCAIEILNMVSHTFVRSCQTHHNLMSSTLHCAEAKYSFKSNQFILFSFFLLLMFKHRSQLCD